MPLPMTLVLMPVTTKAKPDDVDVSFSFWIVVVGEMMHLLYCTTLPLMQW